jgi:cupin superfamily acireductone dioxygenase involved in methionine salvage
MAELETTLAQIRVIHAVQKSGCSLIKNAAAHELPDRSNSIVRFSKWTLSSRVLEAACPIFTKIYALDSSITEQYHYLKGKQFIPEDLMHFGSNYVQVFGAAPEPTHIHATTIVAHVVQGKGILIHEDEDGGEIRDIAEEGDTIVIPVGAPHFFHGDPLVVYTGIEFGPVIDYQKHHLK